jgi:hypothetical protein
MRTDFSGVQLMPIEHKEVGTIYVPTLSPFERNDLMIGITYHSLALAEAKYDNGAKEYLQRKPIKADKPYTKETVPAVWSDQPLPTSLYDEEVMGYANLILGVISTTILICDAKGKALFPLEEAFGTVSNERLAFFSQLSKDDEAMSKLLEVGFGYEKTKEVEGEPNTEKKPKSKAK